MTGSFHLRRRRRLPWFILAALLLPGAAGATQDQDAELQRLRREVEELRRRDAESRKRLEQLERKLDELDVGGVSKQESQPSKEEAQAALDRALEESAPAREGSSDVLAYRTAAANFRLIDVSFDVLTAAGTSTARTAEVRDLQGGAHDPRRRGFTLQQGELSLIAAVDPYFTAEGHIIFVPDGVELEEAFFTTTALPYGLQLEGGYFFTEIGLINPAHPHVWDWIDQPVIHSRLFGGDGLRAPGFRLGWLTPLPWFSELHFGMQNATEREVTHSFVGEEIGGRPVLDRDVRSLGDLLYLARWNHSVDLSPELTASIGASGLYGPNSSGSDGETFVYGADFKMRWRPAGSFRGWPFVVWQTEVMKRDYHADAFRAGTDLGGDDAGHGHGDEPDPDDDDEFPNDLPDDILRDVGLYTQVLYGFSYRWAAGLRYEYAGGSGFSVAAGELASRQSDPTRDDRHRLSPLLTWRPTEYSRFRLQYNYDHADHLSGDDAHSIWLGAEVLYGAHPAHKY